MAMQNNINDDDDMTVTLHLDDGDVECAILVILEVDGQDYIFLLPLDDNGENEDGHVWFYGYSENEDDANEEPELRYIDDDEEYLKVAEAFDEYLESSEFDELLTDEE